MHKTGALAKAVVFRTNLGRLYSACESPMTELSLNWSKSGGGVVAWDIICQSVQVAPNEMPLFSLSLPSWRLVQLPCKEVLWLSSKAAQAATQTAASLVMVAFSSIIHLMDLMPPVDEEQLAHELRLWL